MFENLELIKERRNNTCIYTARYENKKAIVKKGFWKNIEFEELQKNKLIKEGYLVPKTIKILREGTRSYLVEEFIEEDMFIEVILKKLCEGYINDGHLKSAILFF